MAGPRISFDADRSVEVKSCTTCGKEYTLVKGLILREAQAGGVYFAALHDHDGPEAWIDVILSSFEREDFSDNVTFGYRIRAGLSSDQRVGALVPAAKSYGPTPVFGRKLSRVEAVSHPWLICFWELIDFILRADQDVHEHIYGRE